MWLETGYKKTAHFLSRLYKRRRHPTAQTAPTLASQAGIEPASAAPEATALSIRPLGRASLF